MRKNLLLLCVMTMVMLGAQAQHKHHHRSANNFDFSINGGLNMCQIDGDRSGNYNKLGYRFGFNSSFPLGDEGFRMLVEVGVSQKGSTIESMNRTISTTYIEVPIMLAYKYDMGSSSIRGGVGFAPAVLGKASVKDGTTPNQAVEDNFKSFDALPFVMDVQYRFNPHWGLEGRFYSSLLPITIQAPVATYRIFRSNRGAFHRLLSFGLSYTF